MDIVYYRKAAQIMARDGPASLSQLAQRGLVDRNLTKSTKRVLRSYMYTWVDNHLNAHHSHINAWWREKHR